MDKSQRKLSSIANQGVPYFFEGGHFDGSFAVWIDGEPDDAAESGALPHPEGGFLIGFSAVCTHMGCLLLNTDDDGKPVLGYPDRLVCGPCPCHGTSFDLNKSGLVVLGPATQNLPQLELEIDGEDLVAFDWRKKPPYQHQDTRDEQWPLEP